VVIIRIRVFWDVTHYAPIRKMEVAVSSKLRSITSWKTELCNYMLVVIQRIGILHTYIHSMDLEITVDVVCAISHEAQSVQISAVQSIINPVVPEVDCSQHGVSCSENLMSTVVNC
jgi:hypothetical protein